MNRVALTLGALAATVALTLLSGGAYAAPTCTGTTETVTSGTVVLGSFLSGPGNCVIAGDKLFGNFAGTGGTGAAVVTFTFAPSGFGNVTLGISDTVDSSVTTSATLDYQVAVVPSAIALGWRIDDLKKDFTLNQAVTPGATASATLTGTSPDVPSLNISCTRHDPPQVGDNCPERSVFPVVTSMGINEVLTLDANTVVTGLTDTISQVMPEPASLGVLGTGLLGFGLLARRRRR